MHLAIALPLSLVPVVASAFEIARTEEGASLHVERMPLEYEVTFGPDDPTFAAACRRAFDTWTRGARGGLATRYAGPSVPTPGGDRARVEKLSLWPEDLGAGGETVAHTALRYDARTGVIDSAEVLLNAERFDFGEGAPGLFDTESVVLHEIGHVLGLAHSCGDARTTYPSCFSVPDEPSGTRARVLEAVMAPTLSTGTFRRALGEDDLAGIAAQYPSSATVSAVRLGAVARACPEGRLSVGIETEVEVLAELRYSSGRVDTIPAERTGAVLDREDPSSAEGAVDLLVRARDDPGFDAIVPFEPPPACAASDAGGGEVEGPEGCACRDSRPSGARHGLASQVTISLLVMVLLLGSRCDFRRRVPMIAAIVAASWPAHDALAFTCSRTLMTSGPSLTWSERVISWKASPSAVGVTGDPVAGEADLRSAFAAWEDVDCSDIELPFAGVMANGRAGFSQTGENENLVLLVETGWPYDGAAIAVTTSAFDTRTGRVVDADIEVNGQEFRFARVDSTCEPRTGVMDLRNTVTHEVGHLLGLDHPPNTPEYQEATMFASAPPCETKKQSLAQDDIDGVCSIYPKGQPTQQCVPPDGPTLRVTEEDDDLGGCRHTTARGTSPGGALALLALGAALAARVRKRS